MKHHLSALLVLMQLCALPFEAAGQMRLSGDGKGEVLIFPFYSAASGEESNFVIRNHTDDAKALYLRFREGLGGSEVLAFNLYLAPNDSFEAAVIRNPGGVGAAIASLDPSCTVPNLGTLNVSPFEGVTSEQPGGETLRIQPFVNFDYLEDADSSPKRTLVGSLEVFEMGQWSATDSFSSAVIKVGEYTSASAQGDRSGCDRLVDAWSAGGAWFEVPTVGALPWSGGGISGRMVITTARGKLSVPPLAVNGFARNELAAEYHVSPGTVEADWPTPSLANGSRSVQSPINNGIFSAASGLDAISILLAKTEVSASQQTASMGSDRAVIVSFPTKRLHTGGTGFGPKQPFTSRWNPESLSACESIAFAEGRETLGAYPYPGAVFDELCGAINLLSYPDSPGDLAAEAGWLASPMPSLTEYPWVMSFARTSFEKAGEEYDRVFNRGSFGSSSTPLKGMPVIVIPLGVNRQGGGWVKEASLSAKIDYISDSGGSAGFGLQSSDTNTCVGFGSQSCSGNSGPSSDSSPTDAGFEPSDTTVTDDSSGWDLTDAGSGTEVSTTDDFSPGPYPDSDADAENTGNLGPGPDTAPSSDASGTPGVAHFSKLLLEVPREGGVYAGIGVIQGWALDDAGYLNSSIDLYIDGQYQGQIAYGNTRGDVGAAYPSVPQSRQSGFAATFNYALLSTGWHELEVVARDSAGGQLRSAVNFYVERFPSGPYLSGGNAPKAVSGTSCRMVADEIICRDVSLGGGSVDIWLEWSSASQNFEISRINAN